MSKKLATGQKKHEEYNQAGSGTEEFYNDSIPAVSQVVQWKHYELGLATVSVKSQKSLIYTKVYRLD